MSKNMSTVLSALKAPAMAGKSKDIVAMKSASGKKPAMKISSKKK